MNPSKSLMGFFVFALLAAMPAAAHAEDWAAVSNQQGATYYLPQANLHRMKVGAVEVLYSGQSSASRSDARLRRVKAGYELLLPGQAEASVAFIGSALPAAESGAPSAAAARGGSSSPDKDVRDLISANRASLGWGGASLIPALEKLKKSDPAAFRSVKSQGAKAGPALRAALRIIEQGGGVDGAVSYMVALGRVERGPAAQQMRAGPVPQSVAGRPVAPDQADAPRETFIEELTKLMREDAKVQGAVGARLSRYMLGKSGGQAYVAEEWLKGGAGDSENKKALGAAVGRLVQERFSKFPDQSPSEFAVLYFVMGEDQKLGWPRGRYEVLKKVEEPNTPRSKRFEKAMGIFTADAAKARQDKDNEGLLSENPGIPAKGPYRGQIEGMAQDASLESWVGAYAAWAVKAADYIFRHNLTEKEYKDSILKSLMAEETPPGAGQPGSKIPPNLRVKGFGFEDLYEKGAKVAFIRAGDLEHRRRISIKIYSKLVDGRMVDQLGIFDISKPGVFDPIDSTKNIPSNIYGMRVDMYPPREITFKLDPSKEDGLDYKLVIGEDGSIKFGDPTKHGLIPWKRKENFELETSLGDLRRWRYEQASDGPMAEFGGQKFRVIGQGGAKGTFLYFPTDAAGNLPASMTTPRHLAEVSERGPDGLPRFLEGDQPLAKVRGADGKDEYYYAFWNDAPNAKYWDIKKGDKFPEKKEPEKEKEKDKGKGGKGAKAHAAGEEDDESAPSSELSACPKGKEFFGSAEGMVEYKRGDWTLVTQAQAADGKQSTPNNSYLCVKDKMIYLAGMVAESVSVDGKYIKVEGVSPDRFVQEKGLDGKVSMKKVGPITVPMFVSAEGEVELKGKRVFYIPTDGLEAVVERRTEENERRPPGPEKVAWAELDIDLGNKTTRAVTVYLRKGQPPSPSLSEALEKFGAGSLASEEPHKEAVSGYLKEISGVLEKKLAEKDVTVNFYLRLLSELKSRKERQEIVQPGEGLEPLIFCPGTETLVKNSACSGGKKPGKPAAGAKKGEKPGDGGPWYKFW